MPKNKYPACLSYQDPAWLIASFIKLVVVARIVFSPMKEAIRLTASAATEATSFLA
jgi:hypothetical protein